MKQDESTYRPGRSPLQRKKASTRGRHGDAWHWVKGLQPRPSWECTTLPTHARNSRKKGKHTSHYCSDKNNAGTANERKDGECQARRAQGSAHSQVPEGGPLPVPVMAALLPASHCQKQMHKNAKKAKKMQEKMPKSHHRAIGTQVHLAYPDTNPWTILTGSAEVNYHRVGSTMLIMG